MVRDILGRETVIVQPFFTSSQLLASGLNDWSVEAGALRRDFGTASTDYGPAFATATWRHGYSDADARGQDSRRRRRVGVIGLGAVSVLPAQLLGKVAFVASHARALVNAGSGSSGSEHQGLRDSAAIQAARIGRSWQLGFDVPVRPAQAAGRRQSWSCASVNAGSFGLPAMPTSGRFDRHAGKPTVSSGNYSIRIGESELSHLHGLKSGVDGRHRKRSGSHFLVPLSTETVDRLRHIWHPRYKR